MALNFTGSVTTGIPLSSDNDLWVVRPDDVLSNDGDAFDFGTTTGNTLVVEGSIYATGDGVVTFASFISSASNTSVFVRPTGTVFGESDGIELFGPGHTVVNEGSVVGQNNGGIEVLGDGGRIENHGAVTGRTQGLYMSGEGSTIANHGTVTGSQRGLLVAEGQQITNTGTISGAQGIVILALSQAQSPTVWNSGTIIGKGGIAISGSSGDTTVVNRGVIEGALELGAGDDMVDAATGTLNGRVLGEEGDDTVMLSQMARGTVLDFDGGENDSSAPGDSDTLDLSGFGTAVWVALDYFGIEGWTRDDDDLQSGNAWRTIADLADVENIVGTVGIDYLRGDAGANVLGYVGSQIIPGIETMNGRGGSDTADFSRWEAAVWIDLQYETATGDAEAWTQDDLDAVDNGGVWREIVNLDSVENIVGTVGLDVMLGTGDANTFGYVGLNGITGVEEIDGRGGIDTVDFSRFESGIWVDLQFTATEAWTKNGFVASEVAGGTWRGVADLDSIENITGTFASDEIYGNGADNVIDGGAGNILADDVLTGRGGDDTFVFRGDFGDTTIEDFSADDAEKIDLSGVARITSFFDLVNNHISDVGGVAVIDDDSGAAVGNTITLTGFTVANFGDGNPISADDFIF